MSANRVLVHTSVYDKFTELYEAKVSSLKVGDPMDPDTVIGPLINERQAEGLRRSVEKR